MASHSHAHGHAHGHDHDHDHDDHDHDDEEGHVEEDEHEVQTFICELVTGSSVSHLVGRVVEARDEGVVVVAAAHGTVEVVVGPGMGTGGMTGTGGRLITKGMTPPRPERSLAKRIS